MAGGASASAVRRLSAPNVLIYNTQDPSNTSGDGAFDQLELNTTGSVSSALRQSGAYEGLTYWQDPSLALDTADDCNHKNNHQQSSQAQIDNTTSRSSRRRAPERTAPLWIDLGLDLRAGERADFVDEAQRHGEPRVSLLHPHRRRHSTFALTNGPLRNERVLGTDELAARQPNPPVGVFSLLLGAPIRLDRRR